MSNSAVLFLNESDFTLTYTLKGIQKSEQVSVSLSKLNHRLVVSSRSSSTNKPIFETHLRRLKSIYSPSSDEVNLVFTGGDKQLSSIHLKQRPSPRNNTNELISHIRFVFATLFPNVPVIISDINTSSDTNDTAATTSTDEQLPQSLSIAVYPMARLDLFKTHYSSFDIDNNEIGPCGGFAKTFAAYCELTNIPVKDELVWLSNTVWDANNQKTFDVNIMAPYDGKDLLPVFLSLERNTFFEKFHIADSKLADSTSSALISILKNNSTIQEISIRDIVVSKEFWSSFCDALIRNRESKLTGITLCCGYNDDKFSAAFGVSVALLPRGISNLSLAGFNKKSITSFLSSLKKPTFSNSDVAGSTESLHELRSLAIPVSQSLISLDLSNNQLGSEGTLALSDLLAQPNQIRRLNISNCSIPNLEVLFGALARGSLQELQILNVEGNRFGSDTTSFDQYVRSAQKLVDLDMSGLKLSFNQLKALVMALQHNISGLNISLKLGSNDFSSKEMIYLVEHLSNVPLLTFLDLSMNVFDTDDTINEFLDKLSILKSITSINLKKVLSKVSSKKKFSASALKKVFLMTNLKNLCLCDNDLRNAVSEILADLSSLPMQLSISQLDISGNLIGDAGALAVAKFVCSSKNIRELIWHDNGVSVHSWNLVLAALSRNKSLALMEIPQNEIAMHLKTDQARAETLHSSLKSCLYKNALLNSNSDPCNVVSPISPDSSGDGKPSEFLDNAFTLSQQELIEKLSVQVRRVVSYLQDQISKDAVTSDVKKSIKGIIEEASVVLGETAQYSTLLDQLSFTVKEAMSKVSEEQSSFMDSFSCKMGDFTSEEWVHVKNVVLNTWISQMKFIFGVKNEKDSADKVKAQLDLILNLGSTQKLDGKTFEVVGPMVAQTVEVQLHTFFSSMTSIFKTILFDKIVSKLQNTFEKVREEVDRIKIKGSQTSPILQRTSLSKSAVLEKEEVDILMTSIVDIEIKSKPLNHVAKSRPTRPGTKAHMRKSEVVNVMEKEAVLFEEDAKSSTITENESESKDVYASQKPEPTLVDDTKQQTEIIESSEKEFIPAIDEESKSTAVPVPPKRTKSNLDGSTSSNHIDNVSPTKEIIQKDLESSKEDFQQPILSETDKPRIENHDAKPIDTNTNEKTTDESRSVLRNTLNNIMAFKSHPNSMVDAIENVDTSATVISDDPSTAPSTFVKISTPESAKSEDSEILAVSIKDKKKKGLGSKISGLFKRKDKESVENSSSSLGELVTGSDQESSVVDVSERRVSKESRNENSPPKQLEESPSIPKDPISILEEEKPVATPSRPSHTGMRLGVKLPFAELGTMKADGSRALRPASAFTDSDVLDDSIKPRSYTMDPIPPVLAKKPSFESRLRSSSNAKDIIDPEESHPPPIVSKKPDIRGRSDSAAKTILHDAKNSESTSPVKAEARDRSDNAAKTLDSTRYKEPSLAPVKPDVRARSDSNTKSLDSGNGDPPLSPKKRNSIDQRPVDLEVLKDNTPLEGEKQKVKPPIGSKFGVKLPFGPSEPNIRTTSEAPLEKKGDKSPPIPSRRIKPATSTSSYDIRNEHESPIKASSVSNIEKNPQQEVMKDPEIHKSSTKPTSSKNLSMQKLDESPSKHQFRSQGSSANNETIDASGKWKSLHFDWFNTKAAQLNLNFSNGTRDDLTDYVTDGVSLLELLEVLSQAPMPKYKKNAVLPVHKIDNLNIYLSMLQKLDVQGTSTLTAEDLLNGDPKKILLLMNALEKKYQ